MVDIWVEQEKGAVEGQIGGVYLDVLVEVPLLTVLERLYIYDAQFLIWTQEHLRGGFLRDKSY